MKKTSIFFLIIYLSYFGFSFIDIFKSENLYGRFDWDVYTFHVEYLRKSYLEFNKILPLWNPYYGGGFPTWENPSSKLLSITHLFSLIFPSVIALKISFLFYFFLSAILNFHSYIKYTNNSYFSSLIFICLIQFSGYLFQKIFAGHLNQIQIVFLPSLIFYSLSFIRDRSNISAFYVLFISYILLFEGSIYPITQAIFLFFILSIRELIISNSPKKIILNTIILGSIVLPILSFKIIPMFTFVDTYGRFFKPDLYTLNIQDYYSIFLGSSQHPLYSRSITDMQYFYWEYGNYISILPFLLSPLLFFYKNNKVLIGLLSVVLMIMAGNFGPYSPAHFLEKLPIFSQERVYPRWSFSALFLYSWIISSSFENLSNSLSKKSSNRLKIFLLLILCFHVYDLRKKNTKFLNEIFVLEIPNSQEINSKPYPITIPSMPNYGSDSQMLPALINNYSTQIIYENILFNLNIKNTTDSDYCGEFYKSSKCSETSPSKWEIDSFEFENLKANEILILNQKYYPAFTTSINDLETCSYNGHLAFVSKKDLDKFRIYYSIIQYWTNIKSIKNCTLK
jgi:hypothetical protein